MVSTLRMDAVGAFRAGREQGEAAEVGILGQGDEEGGFADGRSPAGGNIVVDDGHHAGRGDGQSGRGIERLDARAGQHARQVGGRLGRVGLGAEERGAGH